MDIDDIAQEIRLKCWLALNSKSYDPIKYPASAKKYLNSTIHNFLFNLKRGMTVPNNGPCNRCKLFNRNTKNCMLPNGECEKMLKYRQNMQNKLALKNPIGYDATMIENSYNKINGVEYDIDQVVLNEYIVKNLPGDLKYYYNCAASGMYVSEDIMNNLEKRVTDLLNERD